MTAPSRRRLQTGEQDWWENPSNDLLPLLRKNAEIQVRHWIPPARSNDAAQPSAAAVQQSGDAPGLLCAIDQAQFMQSIVGNDTAMYHTPLGLFCPHTPMASEDGLEPLKGPRDYAKARETIKKAGYAGEKMVLMVPTDYVALKATGRRDGGQFMAGSASMSIISPPTGARCCNARNNKEPADQGGWSGFITGWAGIDHLSPSDHIALRGNGDMPRVHGRDGASVRSSSICAMHGSTRPIWPPAEICRRMQVQA